MSLAEGKRWVSLVAAWIEVLPGKQLLMAGHFALA